MFENKVALVTGASAGIGLAVCRKLAQNGASIAMVARREAPLKEAALSLGIGEKAMTIPMDVGDLVSLENLPAHVEKHFGSLDFVINNAGIHLRGEVGSRTPSDLAAMVNVNLTAPIVLTRAALPLLKPGSVIVNIASLAGHVPLTGAATYSATKAALRAFSRALNDELIGQGIAVCAVSPGPVDTDFFLKELDQVPPLAFSQPMSSPDTVADAVLECLRTKRQEIPIPWFSAKLATLAYLSPSILKFLKPMMEKKGVRRKAEYAARKKRS